MVYLLGRWRVIIFALHPTLVLPSPVMQITSSKHINVTSPDLCIACLPPLGRHTQTPLNREWNSFCPDNPSTRFGPKARG